MRLDPPLSGEALERRLSEPIIHEPIAESFLYRNASLLVTSQPAVGKSVLAIQIALQLANGLPLFGLLPVSGPTRVWYIQMERSDVESLERLQKMRESYRFSVDNFFLDTELQALNFLKDKHLEIIIDRGKKIKPDVIIIDPLYGVALGLSKDEVSGILAKIFTILKKELNCSLYLNHHTTKTTYDIIGGQKVEKEDPFYGAQWLKAHVTGSYFVKQTEVGTCLTLKKDSHSLLLKELNLAFDHDTYLSTAESENIQVKDRYKIFIKTRYKDGNKPFTFEEARAFLGCTPSWLRQLNCTPPFSDILKKHKSNGRATLYTTGQDII